MISAREGAGSLFSFSADLDKFLVLAGDFWSELVVDGGDGYEAAAAVVVCAVCCFESVLGVFVR